MGAELSTLLAVSGAVDGGDILSQQMSIGGPDNRVGLLNGALNSIFGTPSGIAGHGTRSPIRIVLRIETDSNKENSTRETLQPHAKTST